MMKNLKKGQMIVVTSWCRLTRDQDDASKLAEVIALKQCKLHSLQDEHPFLTEKDNLLFMLTTVVNEYNRHVTAKKTKQIMDRKRQNGEYCGGIPPYGYTVDTNKKLICKKSEMKNVRIIKKCINKQRIWNS